MKERNIYKDIVMAAVLCALAVFLIRLGKAYAREQKVYGFSLRSETELTEAVKTEFEHISGILRFVPADTAAVTVTLEEYTLETELTGVDLEEYPLRWEEAEEEIVLGNQAALFFGEDSFQEFQDKSGKSPGKKRTAAWIEQYSQLSLTVTDETGRVRKAKISGILKEPGTGIYMEKTQMNEIFKDSVRTTGGYMEIFGWQNTQKAKNILESGGFLIEE